MGQGGKHGADTAKVDQRYADANGYRGNKHQGVLDDADPGHGPDAAGEDKSHEQNRCDRHGQGTADAAEAGDRYDDAHARELELQVGNERGYANDAHESGQIVTAVAPDEKVRLRLHPVLTAHFPDRRQDEERDHIGQRQVSQYVERGTTAGIRPAAGAQKGKRRVHFAGHQQEHQQRTKAATAHRPLFQVHLATDAREKADRRSDGDDAKRDRNGNSCGAHGTVPPGLFRAVSIR